VFGVGTLFYALATLTEFFVGGQIADVLVARRTQRMIDSLTDHHIICGFGRVGRQVARDLRAARAQYVVVDSRAENRALAEEVGVRFIEGDGANDAVLIQAGIERARSIIARADSDPENIFITLTARELRADIAIVARAALEDSEKEAQTRRCRPCDLALQGQRD
jgi:voltage-gated potassium channel